LISFQQCSGLFTFQESKYLRGVTTAAAEDDAAEENSWVWLSPDFWEFIDLLLHNIRKEACTT